MALVSPHEQVQVPPTLSDAAGAALFETFTMIATATNIKTITQNKTVIRPSSSCVIRWDNAQSAIAKCGVLVKPRAAVRHAAVRLCESRHPGEKGRSDGVGSVVLFSRDFFLSQKSGSSGPGSLDPFAGQLWLDKRGW